MPNLDILTAPIEPNDPKEVTEELYHYTVTPNLYAILEHQTLRATHTDFMNDREELSSYFKDRLPELLADHMYEVTNANDRAGKIAHLPREVQMHPLRRIAAAEAEKYQRIAKRLFSTFVTSFCTTANNRTKEHGLLSQWRAYGRDGGFALVFDCQELIKMLREEERHFHFSQALVTHVKYLNGADRDVIFNRFYAALEDMLKESVTASMLGRQSLGSAVRAFSTLPAISKHWGFEEEREVRIIAVFPTPGLPDTPQFDLPLKDIETFERADGTIVKFITLFGKNRLPIKRIIVGPHPDQAARTKVLIDYLDSKGLSEIEVTTSGIPYRG